MMSVLMATSGMICADAVDQAAVLGVGVAALHALQHLVVARLDGHFDVRADLGQVAHGLQDAVGHVVGVAGEEADAPEAVDFVDSAQQVGQIMELLIVNC
jgi:hypothetical protein